MHDLQQLAEAAMLQQSREGDGEAARSNPRRLAGAVHANAGSSTTGSCIDNSSTTDASQQPRRTTRQRSARNSAASALHSSTAAPLPPSSFARSPASRGSAANPAAAPGHGGNNSDSIGRPVTTDGGASTAHAAGGPTPSGNGPGPAVSSPSATSVQHMLTGNPAMGNANTLSTPATARPTRRKDKRHSDKKASISSVNTVKSSLSATSSTGTTSSVPALSHTGAHSTTDPSISSAASDISSRTSEGTHATTPEHVSTGEAVHVLYAKGGHQQEYPAYAQSNLPYPVYHHHPQAATPLADGKTGPIYHHIPPPPPSAPIQGISAGVGQPAYVNVHGRAFDPSQVQLYPHDEHDQSRPNSQRDGNAAGAGIQYFIDPYALPVNHPYHPSQTHSLHSATPQLQAQHSSGLNYASSGTAQPQSAHDGNHHHQSQNQQQYANSAPLPPLPSSALAGADYLMQYSHPQASSSAYNGSTSTSAHPNGSVLNGPVPTTANASISANTSSTAETTFNTLNEDKAEEEGQEGATSSIPPSSSVTTTGVPAKKQKGRRPTNLNSESKNHKCKFENCNWSFSRREHLRRHEKTHTQEKPFLCDIPLCGLRFSRLDNLNSHKRTHDKGKRTSQWHVAKVVGAQQAARAGSGSALGEGSEDGRGSVEASTSVLRSTTAADQSAFDESLPPHSAGAGSNNSQQHYTMPGSATLQQNGFPPLPPLDTGNINNGNGASTVGAEVRFAYYDPSQQQPPHSGGAPQHPQHGMVALGGPYSTVRGYQDPFSYSAPPPPQHAVPMSHSHIHPSQHHQHQHHQLQHQPQQQQQHSYHHQPLPPLPPSMHDDSAYMHQHTAHPRGHHPPQPSHLQASGMVNGVPQHQEYDHNMYSTEMASHQMPQHHMMQHHDQPQQQQQQQQQQHYVQHMLPPPPPASSVAIANSAGRNTGSSKRKRNESHRSNPCAASNLNNNNGGGHLNTSNDNNANLQAVPSQMESPSHKRRQSGRKGGAVNA